MGAARRENNTGSSGGHDVRATGDHPTEAFDRVIATDHSAAGVLPSRNALPLPDAFAGFTCATAGPAA